MNQFSRCHIKNINNAINSSTSDMFTIRTLNNSYKVQLQSHFKHKETKAFAYISNTHNKLSPGIQNAFFLATFHSNNIDLSRVRTSCYKFTIWRKCYRPSVNQMAKNNNGSDLHWTFMYVKPTYFECFVTQFILYVYM